MNDDECSTPGCPNEPRYGYLGKSLCESCWQEHCQSEADTEDAVWALLDVSYLAHRARASSLDLDHDDMPTGVLFGFFEQLLYVCSHPGVKTNNVVCCFDSSSSVRKAAYPTYKQKRSDRTSEEWQSIDVMKTQVSLLRKEILPDSGFLVAHQNGMESDDLMAMWSHTLSQRGNRSVIVTADHDLFQCVDKNTRWFDPAKNKMLDEGAVLRDYGVSPTDWLTYKSMTGCSSDCIEGIGGIGDVSAKKYLWKTLTSEKKREAIESQEGRRIVDRNRALMVLPHPATRSVKVFRPRYRADAFFGWCDQLGMKSYVQGPARAKWDAFFSGGVARRVHVRQRTVAE